MAEGLDNTEELQIAGSTVERYYCANDGITYTRPSIRTAHHIIAASLDLSSSHNDNGMIDLAVDPDAYPAQDAYFLEGQPWTVDNLAVMAGVVDSRFEAMIGRVLEDTRKVDTLKRIGEHLETGGNIVNALPHGPLLDIGLLHAMMYVGLGRLGYLVGSATAELQAGQIRTGIVISHGVSGRAKEFLGKSVALTEALSWACNKVWFVTPRTPNARDSDYSRLVPPEHIANANRITRADIASEQNASTGLLVTTALGGTSDKVENGVRHLMLPTLGTMHTFHHERTRVAMIAGKMLGAALPFYEPLEDLVQLRGDDAALLAQGRAITEQMAQRMADHDTDTATYKLSQHHTS